MMWWFHDRPRHWPGILAGFLVLITGAGVRIIHGPTWGMLAYFTTGMTWTIGMALRKERDRANM